MSDDANITTQIQKCLDDINGADLLKRRKGIDKLAELYDPQVRARAAGKRHGRLEPYLIYKSETGDLQQEAWVELLEEVDAGRFPKTVGELNGLLGCVVRNEAVEMLRTEHGRKGSKRPKQEEHANGSGPALVELVADKATGPATAAERDGFWELVEQLPERQRSVYKLHCRGKTLAEIGVTLGMTEDMAKYHRRKARIWLQEKLQ